MLVPQLGWQLEVLGRVMVLDQDRDSRLLQGSVHRRVLVVARTKAEARVLFADAAARQLILRVL